MIEYHKNKNNINDITTSTNSYKLSTYRINIKAHIFF